MATTTKTKSMRKKKKKKKRKKKWYIWGKTVSGRAKCRGGTARARSERGEKRRDGLFFLRVELCVASAPCSRSKLEAGSQKLPVPMESAWSWIILPKGIFIGRECMQKRGHHHKGAAPADLALTQLWEWTHDFVLATFDPQLEQTPRNGLPNFPFCCFCFLSVSSFLPFFLLSFLSSYLFPNLFFPSFLLFLFLFSSFLSFSLFFFLFFHPYPFFPSFFFPFFLPHSFA